MSDVAVSNTSHQKLRRVYGIPGSANDPTLQTVTAAVKSADKREAAHEL
jgi:hypothetical protein